MLVWSMRILTLALSYGILRGFHDFFRLVGDLAEMLDLHVACLTKIFLRITLFLARTMEFHVEGSNSSEIVTF